MTVAVLLALLAPATASAREGTKGAREAPVCTCPGIDVRSGLALGNPAVIATVLREKRRGTYVVRVERSFNARLPRRTAITVRGCWPKLLRGRTLSGFLRRARGRWVTARCGSTSPRALRRGARPYPRPRGLGRLGWLSYDIYPQGGQVLALSPRGHPLGYGFGDRRRSVDDASVCPGAEYVAESASGGTVLRGTVLQVRRLRDLRVVRRVRVPRYHGEVFCRDRSGEDVFLFESEDGRARLTRVRGSEQTTPYLGPGEAATFTASAAYLPAGRDGAVLREVDLDSATKRDIARAPSYVSEWAVSPDGTAFAGVGLAGEEDGPSTAVLIETAGGTPRVLSSPLRPEDVGDLVWLGPDRLAYIPAGDPRGRVFRLFDRGLRQSVRRPLGEREVTALDGRLVESVGRRVYEHGTDGRRGPLITRFPRDTTGSVDVPERPAIAPGATRPGVPSFRPRAGAGR